MKKATACTPQQATTTTKLCAIPRDNVSYRDFWMIVDEVRVTIAQQENGARAKSMTTIPRATFDRFVTWYTTGEWPVRRNP